MTPAEALVERILHAASRNGHDELARLAYGMARSCLARADRKDTSHIRWFEDPREVSDLRRDFGVLATRLGLDVDLSDLPAVSPAGSAALPAGRACIDAAERIDGTTPRIVLIRAHFLRADGQAGESESLLRSLLDVVMPREWIRFVQECRQAAFLQMREFEPVIEIGDQLSRCLPGSLVGIFNQVTALAWVGDVPALEACAATFTSQSGIADDATSLRPVIASEAEWIARQIDRDPRDILSMLRVRGPRESKS